MTEARRGPLVLGLETSCDETSAAVLSGDHSILGHVILSQDVHAVYGGVVPELAARAHLQKIDSVVAEALKQADVELTEVDIFGVTAGPGLIGALLVGVCWMKSVAYGLGRPWVAVHHMEAHLFAPSLEQPDAEPPFVALLVSGGHTLLLHATEWGDYRLLGQTREEATSDLRRESVRTGMVPILNAMAAAGIVSLPGMMTGQILAGSPPAEAVKYQILIMFLIAAGTGFGVLFSIWLTARRLFDDRHRLRLDRLR